MAGRKHIYVDCCSTFRRCRVKPTLSGLAVEIGLNSWGYIFHLTKKEKEEKGRKKEKMGGKGEKHKRNTDIRKNYKPRNQIRTVDTRGKL